jgi:hypothetical protein
MSYTLYVDKNENFECEVAVKNASLKGSIARLIVESDNLDLVFKGRIENDKCIVPIRRLKGILDESAKGNMHLEIIVEDTYFKPWESNYVVEEHTSVKVKIQEQKQSSNKPTVEVKTHPLAKYLDVDPKGTKPTVLKHAKTKGVNLYVPMNEISSLCKQFGINKNNLKSRKKDFAQILKEYFKTNREYIKQQNEIVKRLTTLLK